MHQKNPQGIKRVIKATRYSYQGLCAAFKNEAAFREEVILACVLVPLAVWLDV
ncbi:MAG: diacylglycerol kinase, partial [Vibrio fluvialis]